MVKKQQIIDFLLGVKEDLDAELRKKKPAFTEIDVRVQWHKKQVTFWSGDSQYDTDHRGVWAYGTVTADTDVHELAADMLHDLKEGESVW